MYASLRSSKGSATFSLATNSQARSGTRRPTLRSYAAISQPYRVRQSVFAESRTHPARVERRKDRDARNDERGEVRPRARWYSDDHPVSTSPPFGLFLATAPFGAYSDNRRGYLRSIGTSASGQYRYGDRCITRLRRGGVRKRTV